METLSPQQLLKQAFLESQSVAMATIPFLSISLEKNSLPLKIHMPSLIMTDVETILLSAKSHFQNQPVRPVFLMSSCFSLMR